MSFEEIWTSEYSLKANRNLHDYEALRRRVAGEDGEFFKKEDAASLTRGGSYDFPECAVQQMKYRYPLKITLEVIRKYI